MVLRQKIINKTSEQMMTEASEQKPSSASKQSIHKINKNATKMQPNAKLLWEAEEEGHENVN